MLQSAAPPGINCLNACGICPVCAFSPKSPGSTQRSWKVSDGFKRGFIVELILRCRDERVLESVQTTLCVTSWSLFAYARSKRPACPQDYPKRESDRELSGEPFSVDKNEIWDWFDSSPNWVKTHYICSLLSRCDSELLRTVANLTGVLLVRKKRGFLQDTVTSCSVIRQDRDSDEDPEDPEDPALMVLPGSSKSVSGVSRYRDFINGLPVNLSKRILGLMSEPTLRCCQKVCQYWQRLALETMEELKFRRMFQQQMKAMTICRGVKVVSPTYARVVEVPVPITDDEDEGVQPGVQKEKRLGGAHAKVKTETVQMEERNVYCGAYFTTVLLNNKDPHRVVDYRGGSWLAVGSKDCKVHLLYAASDTKRVGVMKGHVGSIRAVLLCQDRDLVVTASCDTSVRCWDLKTDECVMVLYGHYGTVICLDVHADRLVSGGKDCLVKVWCLNTGKNFEEYKFKHAGPVQCVRISKTTVYSSCDSGLVKIWDMGKASLLRVIDAHRSSVKCLFLDEWHLLSGDWGGQVMAWSHKSDAKQCLMTFSHPKEVKSLTLVYLRVITGCADGKIRIFNFLTGGCLREITVEAETGQIRSLHVHEDGILVNSKSSVKRYHFAKVFWDYAESTEGGQGGQGGVSDTPASLRRLDLASVGASKEATVASPNRKTRDCSYKEPESDELVPNETFPLVARDACDKQSVIQSEKSTSKRMKKRGPHHPLTQDSILLKINAAQREQRTDEVSVNTESNSRLRDSWGPRATRRSLHPDPGPLNRSAHGARPRRTCVPGAIQERSRSHSADPHGAVSATEGLRLHAATPTEEREIREQKLSKNQEKRVNKMTHK
ncbi:F-box and WD repeat domain containing protein 10B [Brachionichthys hirsutus]|uniref:F-box and WD repeat domain containing protein 10B n=1 Tax=Brachionichthys hirsutus TaxID=412623 RepID=UPI0036049A69